MKKISPKTANLILRLILSKDEYLEKSGDLEEVYFSIREETNKINAATWYWYQVIKAIPGLISSSFLWGVIMFKNYFIIAFRNIKKSKGFSFINIAGLALGLTCSILILLWIMEEFSYDRFHKNSDEICRVLIQYDQQGVYQEFLHGALPATLKEEVPEIINSAKLSPLWPINKNPLKYENKSFVLNGNIADASFFDIFSFQFIKGDPHTALSEPGSIVITETTAKKLFGDENPINKIVQFELWRGWRDVKISGVLQDFPHNSSINFDFVIPSLLMEKYRKTWNSWDDICSPAYVLLNKGVPFSTINTKVKDIISRHRPDSKFTLHLQPLNDVHLYNYSGGGPITYIYIFALIGLLILTIAILNYMNLSTARYMKRVKEIGIRKVVGSKRSQIVKQFLSESIIVTFIALIFSLIILVLLLPVVNNLLQTQLKISFSNIILLSLLGITILTGMVSGSYPALFLSSFKPLDVLKNDPKSGSKSKAFRKFLVLTQFTISVLLIACAFTVHRQLDFIKHRNLGYDKEHVINLEMRGDFFHNWKAIKQELLKNPNIVNVTAANTSFTDREKTTNSVKWDGKLEDENVFMEWYPVDYDYLNTLNMKMAKGRFFSNEFPTDAKEGIVLNEAAIKAMEMESPVGQRFDCIIGNEARQAKIIGVVKDFNFRSLHNEVDPVFFAIAPGWYNEFYIKLKSGNQNIAEVINFIENKIKEFVPNYPFDYSFLDDDIVQLYSSEERVGTLIEYGALLAILVACLGLIGLASFDAELRTKEIGIRKVHGASLLGIVLLLSKEYVKWVFIANLLALPIAYYSINKWLQNFAYHSDIDFLLFIISGLVVLTIALFSVCYQIIRAASANPIDSIKYE